MKRVIKYVFSLIFAFCILTFGASALESADGNSLTPPILTANNLSFVYDGESRVLGLYSVSHPLESEGGYYTFRWYKDGELISESETLLVRDVSDSGTYRCAVSFHLFGEVSFSDVRISVAVEKCSVTPPPSPTAVYTGELQTPEAEGSPLYFSEPLFARSVGEYARKVRLRDPENYRWAHTDAAQITVPFRIIKASNGFVGKISVFDVTLGTTPCFSAESTYGEVEFLYSSTRNGTYTDVVPTEVGRYFVRAVVEESDAYFGLTSLPIEFRIVEDAAVPTVSKDNSVGAFLIFLALLSACALTLYFLLSKRRGERASVKPAPSDEKYPDNEFAPDDGYSLTLTANDDEGGYTLSVDKARADMLISDSLAKSLLKRSKGVVITDGTRREVVDIGDICAAFTNGARVDINSLKAVGLVSADCGYLTVGSGGTVDKALTVCANDFETGAVKIIALSGGEAIKVRTVRRK